MHPRRFWPYTIPLVAVALGVGFLSATPAAIADPAPVEARVGVLESPLPGMPTSAVPARRIVSAEVRQDLLEDRVSAKIVLGGAPTAATTAAVAVQFGAYRGGECTGNTEMWATASSAAPDRGFTRAGKTITLDLASDDADGNWNCAIVALVGDDPPTMFDGVSGDLKPVRATPQLRIGKVTLLDKVEKPLRLVPGVWTTIEVPVVNDGRADARNLTVRGSGKGVRVRLVRAGTVSADGGETTQRVEVMLTGRRAATLTLTAAAGTVKATTKLAIKPVAPPPRPVDGRYASADGDITFRVKGGRVVEWRGRNLPLWCYPPFGTPTYQPMSVAFKDTAVARSGIVDATENWRDGSAWYNAWMSMRLTGKKATVGSYTYVTAGSCRITVDFNARWVGR